MLGLKNNTGVDSKRWVGLVLGPVLALIILLFFNLDPNNHLVTRTAAIAVLMAVWWITEAIPIAATALLPVVCFPIMGIMKGKAVAPIYFNDIIFLFIGGFIIALAMQKWQLHRRIALKIIMIIGTSPKKIILGFMVATAFLSMWISNTATTMMMVPIALAVISRLESDSDDIKITRFSIGLLIGIAYAASIGGIATLIGTPPNLAFIKIFKISFPNSPDISFASWLIFGLPFSIIFLLIAWQFLIYIFARGTSDNKADITLFRDEYKKLGPIGFEELVVLIAFVALAILLIFRKNIVIGGFTIPGWSRLLPEPSFIDDGTVAIVIALVMFLIPSRSEIGGWIMDWRTATKLPWGIVILFGGGFALAGGFTQSGLSQWLGAQLTGFSEFSTPVIIISICLMMTFLTELTSNTATTQMLLPILASLSVAIKVNPLLLMIPATISASCAFMLPVATPPNAIIFGSGKIRISQMARTGLVLNFVGAALIVIFIYVLGQYVFNINLKQFPEWAL
jgi:solute carrier family 13 (sodium-dependent dicarboxylate transporter), member 2/3/5